MWMPKMSGLIQLFSSTSELKVQKTNKNLNKRKHFEKKLPSLCQKFPYTQSQKTEIDFCVVRTKQKYLPFFLPVGYHLKETPIMFDVWVQS